MMKLADYESVIGYIENHPSKCSRTVLSDTIATFKTNHAYHTLLSVFLNHLQRKVRATYHAKSRADNSKRYFQIYKEKIGEAEQKDDKECHALIDLSTEFELPPCLMARLVVEQFLMQENAVTENTKNEYAPEKGKNIENQWCATNSCSSSQVSNKTKSATSLVPQQMSKKTTLSNWIKDPYLIPDEKLREQVLQCMSYDVCYGPINDAIRHSIGLEFEEKLKECVKIRKLPFLDENDLRKRGYDKTPDVKLEVPIAVQGHPVCWIESKASFGDFDTHSEYLRSQYHSYWNRFGPGLVIYWFGFIEEISDEMVKQGILVMDNFPSKESITFMNP